MVSYSLQDALTSSLTRLSESEKDLCQFTYHFQNTLPDLLVGGVIRGGVDVLRKFTKVQGGE